MKIKFSFMTVFALALVLPFQALQAKEVVPMLGGLLIDGYDFGKDIGPKGSIAYDEEKNQFTGSYNALKMPAGRLAIFAWLHDTKTQQSRYIGPVGQLKTATAGKNKGRFEIQVPDEFKGGKFGDYEIIGFSSEKTGFIEDGKAVTVPKEPAGSDRQAALKPAFYLFAALPGADTQLHYCGHGQDFFYAKAPDKQVCYD